jgi:phosphoglycerate dehydrogenase-like enzyme
VSIPVGVSRDFLGPDGQNLWGDIGLHRLTAAGVDWEYLPEDVPELRPQDIERRPAVIFAAPAVTAGTFAGVSRPPLVLARFGVGYDAIDLEACTRRGVAVTITPDGARRPVATAALTMVLALLQHVAVKDRLVRENRWEQRASWMGRGLTGRTVGLVGLGNTGRDLVELLAPFRPTLLAYDPYSSPDQACDAGVQLVDLVDLAQQCDVVVVMAALTDETRHLIDAQVLAAMPRHAVLINVARGAIVDEAALIEALRDQQIAGAALDVFESEPTSPDNPLLSMDNVLLSPHCLAWTDEMSAGNGNSAVRAVLDVVSGTAPRYIVNRAVRDIASFQQRLAEAHRP